MNHRLLLAISGISILSAGAGYAQTGSNEERPAMMVDTTSPKPEFGLKIGVNTQSITGNDWEQAYNTGISGGFFIGMHKNKFGIRAEVLASTTSYKSKTTFDSVGHIADLNIAYINIPVLLEYTVIPKLVIQLGPQFSSMISVKKKSDLDVDPKVMFKSGEFSAVVGLEYKLPWHFNVGARYIYGFSDINNAAILANGSNIISDEKWTTRAIQVAIGYSFR